MKAHIYILLFFCTYFGEHCSNGKEKYENNLLVLNLKPCKNKYTNYCNGDKQIITDFGDKYLFLLLSVEIKNTTFDNIVIQTYSEINCFYIIDTILQIGDGAINFFPDAGIGLPMKYRYDSIKPNESRLYYIPFFGLPRIQYGKYIYAKISYNYWKTTSISAKDLKPSFTANEPSPLVDMHNDNFIIYYDLSNDSLKILNNTFKYLNSFTTVDTLTNSKQRSRMPN